MEYRYTGPNKIRRKINEIAETLLFTYITFGSLSNLSMTGHPSADIYSELKKPTLLERTLIDTIKPIILGAQK